MYMFLSGGMPVLSCQLGAQVISGWGMVTPSNSVNKCSYSYMYMTGQWEIANPSVNIERVWGEHDTTAQEIPWYDNWTEGKSRSRARLLL